jgi:serine/threonine protein kinase
MQYLHGEGIVHGDLRGVSLAISFYFNLVSLRDFQNNILINGRHQVRLADFGLSVPVEWTTTGISLLTATTSGSQRFMAPELHRLDSQDFRRTFESDVYAFACVSIEVGSFYPLKRPKIG